MDVTSFYKQFILDLQARFTAIVPEIKFIDQNLGQWGESNFKTAVGLPGMLIDFPTTTYSDIASTGQLALTSIKITLFFDTHSQSYNLAPPDVKNKSLDYYEIESKVVAALQGWSGDYFEPLKRNDAISRNQNEMGLRIRELGFTTQHEEYFEQETVKEMTMVFSGEIKQTTPAD